MRKLRLILFPFAGVYYLITLSRNYLFNKGLLHSKSYPLPVICVGNLSAGGTGKSPMTEYILRLLKDNHKIATLSRGYGRTTKGYRKVTPNNSATEVGDEPLQFAKKFSEVQVAVCENRQTGIEQLLRKEHAPEIIILDDAYQHRKVKPGLTLLLTAYGDLYTNDYLLPAGNLREPRRGAHRADLIVVTKCPPALSEFDRKSILAEIAPKDHQSLYFTSISYDDKVYSNLGSSTLNSLKVKKVTLVTGIANPKPLLDELKRQGLSFNHKSFSDHHNFTSSEIENLERLECILTTEKDYVRLQPLLKMKELYYVPIQVKIVDDASNFDERVTQFVKNFKPGGSYRFS